MISESTLRDLEDALMAAQRDSDVEALGKLLAEDLIFTALQQAATTQEQDLEDHGNGTIRFTSSERISLILKPLTDDVGVAVATFRMTGFLRNQPFEGTYAYTRVWQSRDGQWQMVAGHMSEVDRFRP